MKTTSYPRISRLDFGIGFLFRIIGLYKSVSPYSEKGGPALVDLVGSLHQPRVFFALLHPDMIMLILPALIAKEKVTRGAFLELES